ncbi:MAG TPA: DUF1549 domain-containing protein [Gemmataceae bacterium]|nr:DUF1549 domain-containing protein [Gemmataceae bacterium]
MRKFRLPLAFFALTVALTFFAGPANSDEKSAPKTAEAARAARPELTTGKMDAADWMKASTAPLAPGEIDQLVNAHLAKIGIKPAPLTNDLEFIRRVTLDVTGHLPTPAEIKEFVKDSAPDRRAKLVDKLLASDACADHWAAYWREVISSRTTDFRANVISRHFEKWMKEQIKENKSWASITRDILTATGEMRYDAPDKNGQAFFLAARTGADAENERAAETSRIFLGIQIQCAQCHDHPSDVWKREQFHQLAAYFSKLKDRPIREEKKLVGQSLVAVNFGEHQMPGKDGKVDAKKNAKKGFGFGRRNLANVVKPKFIDGKSPVSISTDAGRRKALADAITSKDDPWFAGAFVNRIWGSMMGQAFYSPIDDLGPEKEATMPDVIARIAGSFRGTDYDVRQLYRAILTSETYQREIRPGDGSEEHLMFAANNPVRMSSTDLWNSLVATLGEFKGGPGRFGKGGGGGFGKGGPRGLEGTIKQEFAFDPSTKAEEIEGSVSQALILMNSPQIEQKIRATGGGILAQILRSNADNDEALRALYLRVLARRPTDREATLCKQHVRAAPTRNEGFEDVLWALINSTEFQTKR